MTEMISVNQRVTTTEDDVQPLDQSNHSHDATVCPNCGENDVVRSETCYADVNALDHSTTGDLLHIPGKLCNAGCGWFQFDRHPETENDITAHKGPQPGDGKIALPNDRIGFVSDSNADVDGEHGIYLDRNSCPRCKGDVRVYVSRIHPDRRQEACQDTPEPVEYKAYAEECCSNTCKHQKP